MTSRCGSFGLKPKISRQDKETAAFILMLGSKMKCEFFAESLPLIRKLIAKGIVQYVTNTRHTVYAAGSHQGLILTEKGLEMAETAHECITWYDET